MPNIVVLYSEDPSFFELAEARFDRRGVDVFCADKVDELAALLSRINCRVIISRSVPGGLPEPALRARLGPSPEIVVLAQPDDSPALLMSYKQAAGATVVLAPYAEPLREVMERCTTIALRHFVRLLVQVKDAGDGSATFAYCQNVSATGMLLELKRELSVGATIRISFMVPGTHGMIDVHARVVRHACSVRDCHRYGLHFTDLTDAQRERIDTLDTSSRKLGDTFALAA